MLPDHRILPSTIARNSVTSEGGCMNNTFRRLRSTRRVSLSLALLFSLSLAACSQPPFRADKRAGPVPRYAVDPPRAKCCKPAPPVLAFDSQGNVVRAWGGKGAGYDWPQNEHGIYVDAAGQVWIGANGLK